jgi:hypothetical protein
VAFDEVVGVEASASGEALHQVERHRGVIGRRTRRQPHPGELERRHRVRDLRAASELERRPERVAEREPEDTANDAIVRIHEATRLPAWEVCPPARRPLSSPT